jgi:hypothetical protein
LPPIYLKAIRLLVEVTLTRPMNGRSELVVTDDSPEGFRDLTDSYTMFAESYKKADPDKRGAFNLGEKFVLALCDEAMITTTTGRVTFDGSGRRRTGSVKQERGSDVGVRIGGWHVFRHTLIRNMRKSGVHPVVVSETVGHKRVELAPEVYDRANQSEIRAALGVAGKQLLTNVLPSGLPN